MRPRAKLGYYALLTAYRKSYMRNRLVLKRMTLTSVYRGRIKVIQSLRHIRH